MNTTHWRPRRDDPLGTAAEVLIASAPALDWARYRWTDADGYIDWDLLLDEWEDVAGAKSSGERRLIALAMQLHRCEVWGLDSGNFDAVSGALRIAATLVDEVADGCRSTEAMFAAVTS